MIAQNGDNVKKLRSEYVLVLEYGEPVGKTEMAFPTFAEMDVVAKFLLKQDNPISPKIIGCYSRNVTEFTTNIVNLWGDD